MELRPPSIAHGVVSFLWGIGIGAFIWVGCRAIALTEPMPLLLGALGGAAVYVLVRLYGEDRPRRRSGAR